MISLRARKSLKIIERIESLNVGMRLGVVAHGVRPLSNGEMGASPNEDAIFTASADRVWGKGFGFMSSVCGYGQSMDEAIDNLWSQIVSYDGSDEDHLYIVVDGPSDFNRRAYRWDNVTLIWRTVDEDFEIGRITRRKERESA